MQGYNAILIFDSSDERILFCHRTKEPYLDKYNFVGGKIEENEEGLSAAYRELYEETGISSADVKLYHLMDLTYHTRGFYMEVYAGRLNRGDIRLVAEKNPLCWIEKTANFYDTEKFAGDGNIGHIVRVAEEYGKDI